MTNPQKFHIEHIHKPLVASDSAFPAAAAACSKNSRYGTSKALLRLKATSNPPTSTENYLKQYTASTNTSAFSISNKSLDLLSVLPCQRLKFLLQILQRILDVSNWVGFSRLRGGKARVSRLIACGLLLKVDSSYSRITLLVVLEVEILRLAEQLAKR